MRVPCGERQSGSDSWRSAESSFPGDMTTNEWQKWLQRVRGFTRTVDRVMGKDIRPYVQVELRGRVYSALVDTGASVNLIRVAVENTWRLRARDPRI